MPNDVIKAEHAGELLGVPGRFHSVVANTETGRILNQQFFSNRRRLNDDTYMRVNVHFDDKCNNGHESFAITADTYERGRMVACGCQHDEVARYFPELAPLIKWHLCSTDGPMHYIANTCHFAGDADCYGRKAGEPSSFSYGVRFDRVPVTHTIDRAFYQYLAARLEHQKSTARQPSNPHRTQWEVYGIPHSREPDKYGYNWTLRGFDVEWYQCPFDNEREAIEWSAALKRCDVELVTVPVAFSAGKARELDAARRAAIWPEATDAQLSVPRPELEAALKARLPALLAEFRQAIADTGLLWPTPSTD